VCVPKISVIVPVYNAEKYLEHCINSILKQTFNDFELLLIDDCSNDKSLEICKKYTQIDKRVKTYHKEINGCTAQSRKTGIFYATAEYVIFIDNDDWVEPEMLEELYRKAISENYDMVYCDFYHGEEYINQNHTNCGIYELIKQVISWGSFYPVTWNKLVRKEKYEKIVFPSTTYSEDRAIMVQILYNCNTVGYFEKAFYHWCIIKKSASRNIRNGIKMLIEDYISYITIIIFVNENIKEKTNEIMEAIVNHANGLGFLCSYNNKIIDEYKNSIKEIIKANNNYIDKITIEQNNFDKKVKELDRKNYKKYIVRIYKDYMPRIVDKIKRMIPKCLKIIIKRILKHGHGT